jgi:hypothetical protein
VGGLTAWGRGQTTRGGGSQETLKPGCFTQVEPLMGWAKPHIGGGPGPNILMLQHIFQHPPTVETVATMNIETGPKIRKHQSGQILCKDVHELGGRWDMQDTDIMMATCSRMKWRSNSTCFVDWC